MTDARNIESSDERQRRDLSIVDAVTLLEEIAATNEGVQFEIWRHRNGRYSVEIAKVTESETERRTAVLAFSDQQNALYDAAVQAFERFEVEIGGERG